MKKLVIIGCGRLAGIVADAIAKGMLPEYELIGAYSRTEEKARTIAGKVNAAGQDCKVCRSEEELLGMEPDFLIETASPAAMRGIALPALKKGISIVTISIGALADKGFLEEVKATAKASGAKVYIASGATGGFDVLRTVSLMGKTRADFFNEKGPAGLKNTSVYSDKLLTEQTEVFAGTATEAIGLFPTKVNVTVAASLASVGPDNMNVRIQSTPYFTGDTQRVEVRNDQVHAVVDIYSATAEIAGWSIVNVLQNIVSPIVF